MTDILWSLILSLLSLSLILAFIRLSRGPSLPDRVIALDIAITMVMGIISVYAVQNNQPAFLDVALILALLSFLGTVAFAYYIERRV
ncbi:MAG: cation:proton antiporter [Anaerolineales bacterium]|nr:cation:proton antiporter [Anaerolineales bacterium]